MAGLENDGRPRIKYLMDLLVSCFRKGPDAGRPRKKTVGDSNRTAWMLVGGLAGAYTSARLCATGLSSCNDFALTFCLISAGAAIGHLCSFFTEWPIKKCLPQEILIKDELEEWIRLVEELSIEREAKQVLIKKEVYKTYKKRERLSHRRGRRSPSSGTASRRSRESAN